MLRDHYLCVLNRTAQGMHRTVHAKGTVYFLGRGCHPEFSSGSLLPSDALHVLTRY